MAILTRIELFDKIKTKLDGTDDETLALIEDVSDTLGDMESRTGEDWKQKYEENDKEWRQKYRDRFFSGSPEPSPATAKDSVQEPEPEKEKTTYEELFDVVPYKRMERR